MSKENIIELERKFIVDSLPSDLSWWQKYDISQFYINIDGVDMRIRNIDNNTFILTKKDRTSDVLGTIEIEKDITVTEYLELMKFKIDGRCSPVYKIRYEKKDKDWLLRCYDEFMWNLQWVIFAEVEFDWLLPYIDFVIPKWWREVTWLITNKKLYVHGKKAVDAIEDKKVKSADIIVEVERYLQNHRDALLKLYKTIW